VNGSLIKNVSAIAAFAAFAVSASAQPTGYARIPVRIHAGVLLLDSSLGPGGVPADNDPYVFYNLDRRTDIKPPGWTFDNPISASTATPVIQARWDAIYNALFGTPGPFPVGTRIGKNTAPYWEVTLSQISEENITKFDVLYIHSSGNLSLSPSDREKIRIFLDAGGTLWFDKATSQTVDSFNGFPVPFTVTNGGANPSVVQPNHPILSYPYRLTPYEAAYMGVHQGTHAILGDTLANLGFPGGNWYEILSPIEADIYRLNPIIVNSAGTVLGVAQMGNGYLIASSSNITSRINEPAGGTNLGGLGPNSGPVGGENFKNIPLTELKFMYNMIALGGAHPALSKGSRRNNASYDEIGAPLLELWHDYNLNCSYGDTSNYFSPVVFKGAVFVTTGNKLYAYKTDFDRDLDGDGNNDDGFQDASIGATRDLIWASTDMPGPLSSPVCVEVANPTGNAKRNMVFVEDVNGQVHVFNAFPKQNGKLLGPNPIAEIATINPPTPGLSWDTSVDGRGPYSPVEMEGLVYVFDTVSPGFGLRNGRVWVIDAATLTRANTSGSDWDARGTGSPNLPEPGGAPTIGYIPVSDGSGGFDKVIYLSNRSSLTGNSVGLTSVWCGVRDESPAVVRNANNIQLTTRAASKGLRVFMPNGPSSYGFRVYLIDTNTGIPLTPAQTRFYLTGNALQFGPGQIQLDTNGSLPANIGVRVDYHIDWGTGAPNLIGQLIRGQLYFPDDINRERRVLKSMALAPNGNLFVTTSNEFNGGSLFCLNEFTRGQFKLVYRWDLHDGYTVTLNGNQRVTVDSALIDRDDLWLMFPSISANPYPTLSRLHFHGSPVIRNNVCYVTVSAIQRLNNIPFGFPATYVLAFDAAPTREDIRLPGGIPDGMRIRQPDIAASTNKGNPERFVNLQNGQADIDTSSGTVRFRNMMSNNNGDMRNAFSSSMPIIVSGNSMPEQLIDPNATGSRWSPLLWFFGYTGMQNDSPPMLMGNTLYVAGGNFFAAVVRGLFPPIMKPALFAMDAEISPNDPTIITWTGHPGLHQVRWIIRDLSLPIGFYSNPHVRWPSGEGVQSFNDFVTRVDQTVLRDGVADMALGVIGGDGTLVSWAATGLFAFKRAATLIADEGRVVEYDSAGFARWSSDVSYESKSDGTNTLTNIVRLQRPTKAYKIRDDEFVVVDTGASRVVRINKGAGEERSITQINLDQTYRPNGWKEGDPLELRQPRDVTVWEDVVPAANNKLTNPQQFEYWIHYLIADTGNSRLIELVDRYYAVYNATNDTYEPGAIIKDANGNDQVSILWWHTPDDLSGKQWHYTAIKRFQIAVDNNGNAVFVYIAGIGDIMPTAVDTGLVPPDNNGLRETGGGPGGLLVFDALNGDQVINEVTLPDGTKKRLIGINSVAVSPTGINGNQILYSVMFTDRTGIYEVQNIGGVWTVDWMITNQVYENLRGVKLQAVYAKRLQNGHVLITNSYNGKTNNLGNPFYGEVTQWVASDYNSALPNLGFTNASVRAELPPVVGTRPMRSPQCADRY
jgi:hypothetical protein